MKTSLHIIIDAATKKRAQQQARKAGVSLSDIVEDLLLEYGRTNNTSPDFKSDVAVEMRKIDKDIREGKNLSPAFSSAKEAISYLRSRRAR